MSSFGVKNTGCIVRLFLEVETGHPTVLFLRPSPLVFLLEFVVVSPEGEHAMHQGARGVCGRGDPGPHLERLIGHRMRTCGHGDPGLRHAHKVVKFNTITGTIDKALRIPDSDMRQWKHDPYNKNSHVNTVRHKTPHKTSPLPFHELFHLICKV